MFQFVDITCQSVDPDSQPSHCYAAQVQTSCVFIKHLCKPAHTHINTHKIKIKRVDINKPCAITITDQLCIICLYLAFQHLWTLNKAHSLAPQGVMVSWSHEIKAGKTHSAVSYFLWLLLKVGPLDNIILNKTGSCSIPLVCTATHYLNQCSGTFQCLRAIWKTPNLVWAANQFLTTGLVFFYRKFVLFLYE
jgi:hypothetical protein